MTISLEVKVLQEDKKQELPKLSMLELILAFFSSISSRTWARLGLVQDEYGDMYQNLKEARLGIDTLDAVLKVLKKELSEDTYSEMENLLSNLKLNYVHQSNKEKKDEETSQ